MCSSDLALGVPGILVRQRQSDINRYFWFFHMSPLSLSFLSLLPLPLFPLTALLLLLSFPILPCISRSSAAFLVLPIVLSDLCCASLSPPPFLVFAALSDLHRSSRSSTALLDLYRSFRSLPHPRSPTFSTLTLPRRSSVSPEHSDTYPDRRHHI